MVDAPSTSALLVLLELYSYLDTASSLQGNCGWRSPHDMVSPLTRVWASWKRTERNLKLRKRFLGPLKWARRQIWLRFSAIRSSTTSSSASRVSLPMPFCEKKSTNIGNEKFVRWKRGISLSNALENTTSPQLSRRNGRMKCPGVALVLVTSRIQSHGRHHFGRKRQ